MIHTITGKKVWDLEHLKKTLEGKGYLVQGVGYGDGVLYIQLSDQDTKDPKPEVNAYVNPDYYEITSALPSEIVGELRVYKLGIGGSGTFTITKKSGATDAVKPDADMVEVFWPICGVPISQTKVTLQAGVGTVTLGPAPFECPTCLLEVAGAAGRTFVGVRVS